MQITEYKIGERRVRDGNVSFEILGPDGRRAGMFRVNATAEMAAKLIAAQRITIEAGPR